MFAGELERLDAWVHDAPLGFERELAAELGRDASRLASSPRLFLAPRRKRRPAWAANTWLEPVRIRFETPTDAAMALAQSTRRWTLHGVPPAALRDVAASVARQLPRVKIAPAPFPPGAPLPALGAYALVGEHEIVASAKCTSAFPDGEVVFQEDRTGPPSRAYLKLWEAFTVAERLPTPGVRCVDLGSSPGGWTWALERLGARVISVDKAPIDPRLTRLTRVRYVQDSAFAIDPTKVGRVDWLVSDVICYPERSVKLIERWLAAHPAASFVVTIKLQGKTDTTALRALDAIEGGRLVHLAHNKHELTWLKLGPTE
jgi:23S rRNA (cytidine2498-2'-O)-methyltransferase